MVQQQDGQSTPSLSPTPSPAGSVGSVTSQSSGYNSGELTLRAQPAGPNCCSVPQNVHTALLKQYQDFNILFSSHEKWDRATNLVVETNSTG